MHDWPSEFDHDYGHPVGTPEQRKIAHMSTAEGYLDTWTSPVFIEQGDDDRNVPFSQSVDLATKLRARGVTVRRKSFRTRPTRIWSGRTCSNSTGQPRRFSRIILVRKRRRDRNDGIGLVSHFAKALIVRLTRIVPLVNLLDDRGKAKDIEDVIPGRL